MGLLHAARVGHDLRGEESHRQGRLAQTYSEKTTLQCPMDCGKGPALLSPHGPVYTQGLCPSPVHLLKP